jgi:glutathione S-transferase
MPILYHFAASPFSRRVRLGLAHKGISTELREARQVPGAIEEARSRVALKTIPVLVDGDRALADSMAITRWLDAAYPERPRIWPEGQDAFCALEVTTLVDTALNAIIDVATRYYPLRGDPSWASVKSEMLGRAQRALDGLCERVTSLRRPTVAAGGWSAGDMWLVTAVQWLEGLPDRTATSPNAAQIVAVGGWTLPDAVRRWTEQHRDRPELRALGQSSG